jgi:hypothetical protein
MTEPIAQRIVVSEAALDEAVPMTSRPDRAPDHAGAAFALPRKKGMSQAMATTGSVSKRSLVAAIIMIVVSGCAGSTTSPSATSPPTTAGSAQAEPVPENMTGGRYLFGPFGDSPSVDIVATGPDGWFGYPSWAMDGPKPVRADAPTGIGVSFFTADGVYSDPCHWDVLGTGGADVGDVEVGPTVDDLVAALRANTFYTSSEPTPVTIDGYAGQELELQLPDDPFTSCDKEPGDSVGHAFVFSGPGLYAQGPANRWHLYILDVEGTRLIAVILSYAQTPQGDLDLSRNVIETLDIAP